MRWDEECQLLKEEMKRTVRYMRWYKCDWEAKGKKWDAEGDMGRGAYARKYVRLISSRPFEADWLQTKSPVRSPG